MLITDADYHPAAYLCARQIQTLLNSGLIVGSKVVSVGHSASAAIMFII
jgi:hypothetical protein